MLLPYSIINDIWSKIKVWHVVCQLIFGFLFSLDILLDLLLLFGYYSDIAKILYWAHYYNILYIVFFANVTFFWFLQLFLCLHPARPIRHVCFLTHRLNQTLIIPSLYIWFIGLISFVLNDSNWLNFFGLTAFVTYQLQMNEHKFLSQRCQGL